jgi:hypothetical protein
MAGFLIKDNENSFYIPYSLLMGFETCGYTIQSVYFLGKPDDSDANTNTCEGVWFAYLSHVIIVFLY